MSIAVIGLGGAGGNIANEAAILGLQAGAINFSQKDLDSADNVKYKLKVMGSEGVGHDRDLAIELVKEHYPMITGFVKENFSNPLIDVIAFTFATGGGSGSGIAPILIDIMTSILPEKTFMAIPIIPDLSETTIIQSNCADTFSELASLDICMFPIDNQAVKNRGNIGKGKIYETTNIYIANQLSQLSSYTEKYSRNGNFDRKDFSTLLRQKGMAIITEIDIVRLPEVHLNPEAIAAQIQDSWDDSIFAPIEYDHVAKSGIIFDGQEELLGYIDHELIFDKFKTGTPIDLFEGNYHEENGKVITILTGLPWCRSRLDVVDKLVEKGRVKIEVSIANEKQLEYQSKTSDMTQKFRARSNISKESISEKLSKYRR